MKINKSTRIVGKNVILVPYKEQHVLRYHDWMKSIDLQHLTASEPLTLDEEYKMQTNWCEDEDKCTFIILSKSIFEKNSNEIDAMIGDTNLFLYDTNDRKCAEIQIMIAEIINRGKGYGWEALILMLRYGIEKLSITKYIAKISMDNDKSMHMFNKLGFKEISKSDIFKEVTLLKHVDHEWHEWLNSKTSEASREENYK